MREILFKAKRKDNGKWIEGYYQKRYDLLGKQWKEELNIEIKTTWTEYKPTINELLNFRDGDKAIQYLVERGLNTNSLMK